MTDMGDGNQELIADFVTESREHLATVEGDLLRMEEGGATATTVNNVFRCVHSVKGVAGFLGLERINELAHTLESVLDLVRKDRLQTTPDLVEVLLTATDRLRELVEDVHNSNQAQIADHVQRLRVFLDPAYVAAAGNRVASAAAPASQPTAPPAPAPVKPAAATLVAAPVEPELSTAECEVHWQAQRRVWRLELGLLAAQQKSNLPMCALPDHVAQFGELLRGGAALGMHCAAENVAPSCMVPIVLATELGAEVLCDVLALPAGALREVNRATIAPAAAATPAPAAPAASAAATPAAAPGDRHDRPAHGAGKSGEAAGNESIRVSTQLLDRLMNLSGELVLGRNQLLQAQSSGSEKGIHLAATRLNQVVSEMQDAIMQTRMQPLANVFQKFPRVVRDLASKLGKKIRLDLVGKEVEVDRSILEALSDPLTHLIRNSCDHGIELPAVRRERGKGEEGVIELRACHQGGNVVIAIRDDGGGIDPVRLRTKAVEKGVITAEQAKTMNDRDAVHLIFAPGFSTAEKLTDVSGRGVGMDVVNSNIERLNGSIDVHSVVGEGTVITVTIPLTLAILPALVVSSGGLRYVLPQANVTELVRVRADEVGERIVSVKGRDVLRLRGRLLPIVHLRQVLGHTIDDAMRKQAQNIMVIEAGLLHYGLVVDAPPDAEEIVVKPLGRHMQSREEYAGSTILGDGRVAMILDVGGLASAMGIQGDRKDVAEHKTKTGHGRTDDDVTELVLFRNHPEELFSVPLGLVGRIQRIDRSNIRQVAGNLVYTTEERSMPLVQLERQITAADAPPLGERTSVLVLRVQEREFGLIAPAVEDIRAMAIAVDGQTLAEPCVLGSFQLAGAPVRLLDVAALARKALPNIFKVQPPAAARGGAAGEAPAGPPRVLLAEDSSFFRAHVARILGEGGFEMVTAEDGEIAWNLFQDDQRGFQAVVTDIEMPNCDGLELTRRVRADARGSELPVLALTSLSSEEDVARGCQAGVNRYLVKLDDVALLNAVRELVGVKA